METISPDRTLLNLYVPSGLSCANRCLKFFISKKPEIWPVSYPKMIPPIETKAPSRRDRHVTHGTCDSSMKLPLFSRLATGGSSDKSVNGGDPVPPASGFLRNGNLMLGIGDWRSYVCILRGKYAVLCVGPNPAWFEECINLSNIQTVVQGCPSYKGLV